MKLLFITTLLLFGIALSGQYNYGLEVEQQDAKIEGKLWIGERESLHIGVNAGENDNLIIGFNTFVGGAAGQSTIWSQGNTAIGWASMRSNISGNLNTALGIGSLNSPTVGNFNTAIGNGSLSSCNSCESSTAIGDKSMSNMSGSYNTSLGAESGLQATGDYNLFLGFKAGYFESNSNRLYIENSDSSQPLYYGEFENDKAGINWDSSIPLPATLSINGTLHISETAKLEPQTTAPSTCTTAAEYGLMYYDNSSTTHKLKVCTNAGWEDLN